MVVAVVSQKGGVGKTTLCLNLGHAFAVGGARTLLIDVDPQGGIGNSVSPKAAKSAGLAALLGDGAPIEDSILSTRVPGFDLLPVGRPTGAQLGQWSTLLAGRLRAILNHCDAAYDLVLIDTPSGLQGATYEIMKHVEFVITPLQAEPMALRSLRQLLEAIAHHRQSGSSVQLCAVIPTMAQSRDDVSLSSLMEAYGLFPDGIVIDTFIPRDNVFLRASRDGVPVRLLERRPPPVAAVFDQIAGELEPRLDLHPADESYVPQPLLD